MSGPPSYLDTTINSGTAKDFLSEDAVLLPKKKKQGTLSMLIDYSIATFFILFLGGMIFICIQFGPGSPSKARVITFDDLFDSKFQPKVPSGSFFGENSYSYLDDSGIWMLSLDNHAVVLVADQSKCPEYNFSAPYTLSSDGHYILIPFSTTPRWRHSFYANYLIWNTNDQTYHILGGTPSDPPNILNAQWSNNDDTIVYVQNSNMYLTYAFQPLTVKPITTDGSLDIEYGLMPWVYEEEVFSDYNAIWWKPKGTSLPDQFLFFKSDSSMVRTFQYPIYNDVEKDSYNTIDSIKYPKSGTNNSKVYLSLYNTQNGTFLTLPLDSTDEYVTDVAWPYENQLAVRTSNRIQTVETIHIFSISTDNVRKVTQFVTQSVDNGWIVPRPYTLFFFKPWQFTMVRNNSDYYHIYMVNFTDTYHTVDAITSGSFDVTDVVGYSEKNGIIFFLSTENGQPFADPTSRHIWVASVSSKQRKKLNPDDKAYYSTTFNDNGSYFVCNYQGPQIPNTAIYQSPQRIDLPWNWNTSSVKVLEDNAALKELLAGYTLPTRTYINVTSADSNITLSAWYMFPPALNTSNYYPLLLDIYCGPNSQTVTQQWELGFDEYLVSKYPVVVASIDTRGTGARGISFMQQVYRKLGILESADLLAGMKSLSSKNLQFGQHIDAGRMGIWGWSYGGFMSLNTLARDTNNLLVAAVSVAPVTDWRLYDTFYTERYMSTPQDNPEGYNSTSILNLANNLLNNSKPLLVVHGTGDDNVHFQNSALLNKKLFEIGYQYEMLYYANKQHGISGNAARRHLYTAISNFLVQNLISLPATMELPTNN